MPKNFFIRDEMRDFFMAYMNLNCLELIIREMV